MKNSITHIIKNSITVGFNQRQINSEEVGFSPKKGIEILSKKIVVAWAKARLEGEFTFRSLKRTETLYEMLKRVQHDNFKPETSNLKPEKSGILNLKLT